MSHWAGLILTRIVFLAKPNLSRSINFVLLDNAKEFIFSFENGDQRLLWKVRFIIHGMQKAIGKCQNFFGLIIIAEFVKIGRDFTRHKIPGTPITWAINYAAHFSSTLLP